MSQGQKMNKTVYDSRFFIEFFYTKDKEVISRLKELKKQKNKYISAIVIHEVHKFSILREGRDTAKLRVALMREEFQVIPVDEQLAQMSADLRVKYKLSMGDSMITTTAIMLKAVCFSDDPHFQQIKEIKTAWI
jgi:predicted nucleic acid-binding protein